MTSAFTGDAIVRDPTGLHARPAVKVSKTAKQFNATVEISAEGSEKWVNAKSISAVMKLRVNSGKRLLISAQGDDAESAVRSIITLVEKDFKV